MIIDANVFKGYFEAELNKPHCLCGCPKQLLAMADASKPIYHDSGEIIEQEWRNVVSREWFDGWLAGALASGIIAYKDSKRDETLENQLRCKGFPLGRDIIYIRTALSIAASEGRCDLYTEDLDFYDPKKKSCSSKSRFKILQDSSGPVAKILKKSNIHVSCVP